MWLAKEIRQVCDGGCPSTDHVLGDRGLNHRDPEFQQFAIDLRRSQEGFAMDTARIKARRSVGIVGRPVRRRLVQVHNRRKPWRC